MLFNYVFGQVLSRQRRTSQNKKEANFDDDMKMYLQKRPEVVLSDA